MGKKMLKICISVWSNESRDKRELSLAQELGADVMVMAKGDNTGKRDMVDGFEVYRVSARPISFLPRSINRIAAVFIWANHAKKLKPDVISGHDLIALFIGYMASVTMKKSERPILVYDSHEFEIERNARRNKVMTWFILHLERFLIHRCAFSIMVNDSIANEVKRIHKLEVPPVVARNIPYYWKLDRAEIENARRSFNDELQLGTNTFLVVYHGGLMADRGIEQMLYAISQLEDTAAIVLGDGANDYISELKILIKNLSIENRAMLKPAVPLSELYKYVGAADVGTVMLLPANENHIFTLPNKFFENIQSMTPVIVSDFPEVGKLTETYGIGIKVDPCDANQIIAAIEKMRTDKEFYKQCKENLKKAKIELCWEKEKEALQMAYRKVLSGKI